jgi:hypothetical protein
MRFFRSHANIIDCLFLACIIFISSYVFIPHLGFYSDDWDFLARFVHASDQSVIGLFHAVNTQHTQMRPVQGIYFAMLYSLFGLQPLGYHIINCIIQILLGITFYLVLRKISLPRVIAVSLPLLYLFLPHYSADRFWFAAFQANLSMLFYFISLLTGLSTQTINKGHRVTLQLISILCIVLSALSYEVVIPLFVVHLILWKKKHQHGLFITTMCTVIAVVIFKTLTTTRLTGPWGSGIPGYTIYVMHIAFSALSLNYGRLGLFLPATLWNIFSHYFQLRTAIISILLGGSIFCYIYNLLGQRQKKVMTRHFFAQLTLASFVFFMLGYAIFFTNNNIGFYAFGIGNRVAIAAAVGIAMTYLGIIGWISTYFKNITAAKAFFSLSIAFVCASFFLINTTIARYWLQSYRKEQHVLTAIQTNMPVLPKGSTILLDNVCPYDGPAIVFESSWDLKGALHTMYEDQTLSADVIKPTIRIQPDGVYTKIYDQVTRYPYKELYIFNYKDYKTTKVNDQPSIEYYFRKYNPSHSNYCPQGVEGNGVSVF